MCEHARLGGSLWLIEKNFQGRYSLVILFGGSPGGWVEPLRRSRERSPRTGIAMPIVLGAARSLRRSGHFGQNL